jgi:hypothetical protein
MSIWARITDEKDPIRFTFYVFTFFGVGIYAFLFMLPISVGFAGWLTDKGTRVSCHLFDPDFKTCKQMKEKP